MTNTKSHYNHFLLVSDVDAVLPSLTAEHTRFSTVSHVFTAEYCNNDANVLSPTKFPLSI